MDYVGRTVKAGPAGLDLGIVRTDWVIPAGGKLTITKEIAEIYNIAGWIDIGAAELIGREEPAPPTPPKDLPKG